MFRLAHCQTVQCRRAPQEPLPLRHPGRRRSVHRPPGRTGRPADPDAKRRQRGAALPVALRQDFTTARRRSPPAQSPTAGRHHRGQCPPGHQPRRPGGIAHRWRLPSRRRPVAAGPPGGARVPAPGPGPSGRDLRCGRQSSLRLRRRPHRPGRRGRPRRRLRPARRGSRQTTCRSGPRRVPGHHQVWGLPSWSVQSTGRRPPPGQPGSGRVQTPFDGGTGDPQSGTALRDGAAALPGRRSRPPR